MMISSTVAASAAVVGLRNLVDLAMRTNQQRCCCWYYRTAPVAIQCLFLHPLLAIAAFASASDCLAHPVVVAAVAAAVQ